jgi:hypothetical protein
MLAVTPVARQVADECVVVAPPGQRQTGPARNVVATVGLTDRVDPTHAPRPTNDSERLVFRQLYESLVRVDCMGGVVPGLAASWRLDADRRTWIVTLREDARFSDGTRVTASAVRASWARDGDSALRAELTRLVESIAETDDRTLAIRLQSPRVDMPLSLAHPDLAITKATADSAWPLGTRGLIAAGRTSAISLTRGNTEALRFLVASGDPRDLLDRGVDVLLTRNRATLDYAATLSSFQSTPLAWGRTHVLLTPSRARAGLLLSDDQREVLAHDAVRGDARGARGPFWWQAQPACTIAAAASPSRSLFTPRIVYDASDDVARDLAERFVGLVRAAGSPGAAPFLNVLLPDRPRRTYQRATGLTGEPLAQARQIGTDAGYIVALENHPIDPCRDLQLLTGDVPWLDPETMVPLVDTRLHAIVRRATVGVTAEGDGGLLIDADDPTRGGAAR